MLVRVIAPCFMGDIFRKPGDPDFEYNGPPSKALVPVSELPKKEQAEGPKPGFEVVFGVPQPKRIDIYEEPVAEKKARIKKLKQQEEDEVL